MPKLVVWSLGSVHCVIRVDIDINIVNKNDKKISMLKRIKMIDLHSIN